MAQHHVVVAAEQDTRDYVTMRPPTTSAGKIIMTATLTAEQHSVARMINLSS